MRAAFLFLLFIALPTSALAENGPSCKMVESAVSIAAKIRGLKLKQKVPCSLQGKPQVEKYLRDTLDKKIPADRVRNEGKVYELLGIVPLGFQYRDQIIKLYTDQLGGYYDPERAAYVMADWLPAAMQMPIAVHELTHALQDQHFKLEEMLDEKHDDSDSLMARSGLIEGDATAVMLDYARSLSGQPGIAREETVSAFMMQNITGAMLSAGVSSAPPALQAMLIFPYVSGLRFVHQLLRHGGFKAVDEAFRRPPQSSEEILHPDIYLKKELSFYKPGRPEFKEAGIAADQKPVFEDRFGEFVISTMLGSFVPAINASKAASGWGGDRIWLFEVGPEKKPALIWRTLWDTEEDAGEFFAALHQGYAKRFGRTLTEPKDANVTFSETPVGRVSIGRDTKSVDLKIY